MNSPVPYRELYGTALRLVGELAAGHTRAAQDLSTAAARMLPRALIELSAELAVKGDPVWCMRDRLETLSNYLEVGFEDLRYFILSLHCHTMHLSNCSDCMPMTVDQC